MDEKLAEMVQIGALFQHYKGKKYKVLSVARNSEKEEELCVVYQGQYTCDTFGDKPIWVRPVKVFLETIEFQGKKVPRFKKI
jgi:hypothetical protein